MLNNRGRTVFGDLEAPNANHDRRYWQRWFSMNYSTGGKGGRGAGIAWNVHAPRKLVSLPCVRKRSGACLLTVPAVSVRRTPTRAKAHLRSRILTHTGDPAVRSNTWSQEQLNVFSYASIAFENASPPNDLPRLAVLLESSILNIF